MPQRTPPPVELPRLPGAPTLPIPGAPTLPVPAPPTLLGPQASPPGSQAPRPALPAPLLPPASTREAAPSPGARAPSSVTRPGGERSASSASPGGGSGSAPQAHSRPARQRRLQRKIHRLAGCLDAVSGLERRILVLRAGLGDYRPHTRRAAAERLGVSVKRVRRAERRGLRKLTLASRDSSCAGAGGGPSEGAESGGGAGIAGLAAAPMMAELLGAAPRPGAGDRPSQPARGQPGTSLAGAPAAPGATTAESDASFPFIALLALLAAALAAFLLRPGLRVAGGALQERSERSVERRQQQLVAAVNGILDERE